MLKVGGIWCSPFEIESKLIEHPDVVEAAVVGRVDQEGLLKPEAFVILKEGTAPSDALVAELMEFCKSGLAPYKYPRWINSSPNCQKPRPGKFNVSCCGRRMGPRPASSEAPRRKCRCSSRNI
jgi:acyl-coenzyme A synthetase/AMP-(fatty) acid ligase